jgi:hypothetical protein
MPPRDLTRWGRSVPFLTDRRRRAGRFLEWKVGLFSVAAVLGLAGISLEERWMTGGAIVVLLGAMLLRLLPGAHPRVEGEEQDEEARKAGAGEGETPGRQERAKSDEEAVE